MEDASPKIRFARSKPDEFSQQVARLRKQSGRAAALLARLDNVVSVTIGDKHVGGEPTGRLALVAHVTRKGGPVAPEHTIPSTVEIGGDRAESQLPTDVVELGGMPEVLAARAGDTIWSGDSDYGTACLTFIKNGKGHVTTNAHVVANIARGRFYLPNVMNPAGSPAPLTLGNMAYMSPFAPGRTAREDMAIVETTADSVVHLGMVGEAAPIARIDSFADISTPYWYNVNGMRVMLGRPQPSPATVSTPMLIDGIWYPYADFWMLKVTAGQVQHGHSGAVICRGSGSDISACGILFGGVLPGTAYAFQLQPTFRQAYDRI